MSYTPPFKISAKTIQYVSDIASLLERFKIRLEQKDSLRLRKINKMKSIHGSLAIEGNSLSEDEVSSLIEGKTVIAPLKEIQEVKNAIKTYEKFSSFNPFSKKDLLKAHEIMTLGLVEHNGKFRKGGIVVAGKEGIAHIAPPADRVPFLIDDLFEWLEKSEDHILIKISVFHYEFEFIHPFEDGNGRMGRFWQSRLLAEWNQVFEFLPIENMIWENQSEYYKAIQESTDSNDSGIFVEFMLFIILKSLQEHSKNEPIIEPIIEPINLILSLLKENPSYTKEELAEKIGKSRATVTRILSKLVDEGKIKRIGSNKTGHWEILNI